VSEEKKPCQLTGPWTLPFVFAKLAGTGNATPERKISSLPLRGTVVIHVFEAVSKVVEEQEAFGSNVIWAFGTLTVYPWSATNVTVEALKVMVAPVLGIPVAVKFALNQMKLPDAIGVPLKFEMFVELVGQFDPPEVAKSAGALPTRIKSDKSFMIVLLVCCK